MISRQSDALALSADTDNSGGADLERNKVVAKNILRKLSGPAAANSPALLTVDQGAVAFHILHDGGVLFLTMCDATSPAALAFSFLEDVSREFLQQYGQQVGAATRPYLFIKFDLYLQKTKKVFSTATSARSAAALQRQGRPQPVKRSFREIMGHVEGGEGRPSSPKAATKDNTTTIVVVAASLVAAAAMIFIFVYVIFS